MITPEERLARKGFIGSSDAPAICRVDPDKGPLAVYLEKVFDVEELPNKGPIARGNRWESTMLDWAREELGVEIERNVSVRHPDGIRAANLDGRVKGKRIGVEAKYTGLGHLFGEPGTDEIPEKVIVQATHQMYVADLELVYVPVLLARFNRPVEVMFQVPRNEDLIKSMVAIEQEFWEENVLRGVPPPLDEGPPPLDVIKRIRRQPKSVAQIDPELVEAWEDMKLARKIAEDREEAAKAAVLAALGGSEAGEYGDPAKILTYFRQTRTDLDSKALRAEHPEIFDLYQRSTEFPVARIVKRK